MNAPNTKARGGIIIRTVPNVMYAYGCSAETAQRYVDLRDEGYSMAQAKLMAGLSDPDEDFLRRADTSEPSAEQKAQRNDERAAALDQRMQDVRDVTNRRNV